MEILELPGYTEEEKLSIAERYLVPKQVKAHGLTDDRHLDLDDAALRAIIEDYTREAGVRNLEREIASVCRKVGDARSPRAHGRRRSTVDAADKVRELLGPPRTSTSEVVERIDGRAWRRASPGRRSAATSSSSRRRDARLRRRCMLTGQLGDDDA